MKMPFHAASATFIALLLTVASRPSLAATVTKAATGTDLTAGASWGGTAPTATDIAEWDASSLGTGLTVGSAVSWGSINITGAASNIGITGSGKITTGNVTLAGGQTLTVANAIGLSANSVYTIADATGDTTADATLTGIVSGAFSLTKEGAGTLQLSGANTYSGGTIINSGTVDVTTSRLALGTGGVTVASGATLNLSALNGTSGNSSYTGLTTSLSGAGTVNFNKVGTVSYQINMTGDYSAFTGTWNVGDGTTAGAGKILLAGADNASMTINVKANATLYSNSTTSTTYGAPNITTHYASVILNGGDTGETLGQLRLDNGTTWAGTVTLAGEMTGTDSTIGTFWNGTGAVNTSTISGAIGETGGSHSLSKGGTGTTILSGTNTYTGDTTVRAGTLRIGDAGTLGSGNYAGNIALSVTGATLDVATSTDQVLSGVMSGTGKLLKNGTGILTLSSAGNTYSGTTTVTAGTLLVNNTSGSGTGTGAVTVQTGATLGGTGAMAGAVTVNSGATLAAGAAGVSAGTLTVNSNFSQSGSLLLDTALGGSGAATDHLAVNGTVTLNSTGTLDVNWGGGDANKFYAGGTLSSQNAFWAIINDGTDAISGKFANASTASPQFDYLFPGGTSYSLFSGGQQFAVFYQADYAGNTAFGGNDVLLIAVPEPGRAALGLLAVAALTTRRRRRA